jgi:hypothetical protein
MSEQDLNMPTRTFNLRAKLWKWDGNAAWHFVTLSKRASAEINTFAYGQRAAWGSIRVTASVGKTSWSTSIFPDSKSGSYVLPVKAAVRKAEGLTAGRMVRVRLEVAGAVNSKKSSGARSATGRSAGPARG